MLTASVTHRLMCNVIFAIVVSSSGWMRFCWLSNHPRQGLCNIKIISLFYFIFLLIAFIDSLQVLFFEEIAHLLKWIFLFYFLLSQIDALLLPEDVPASVVCLSGSQHLRIEQMYRFAQWARHFETLTPHSVLLCKRSEPGCIVCFQFSAIEFRL